MVEEGKGRKRGLNEESVWLRVLCMYTSVCACVCVCKRVGVNELFGFLPPTSLLADRLIDNQLQQLTK